VLRRKELRIEAARAAAILKQHQWRQSWLLTIVHAVNVMQACNRILEQRRAARPALWRRNWAAHIIGDNECA